MTPPYDHKKYAKLPWEVIHWAIKNRYSKHGDLSKEILTRSGKNAAKSKATKKALSITKNPFRMPAKELNWHNELAKSTDMQHVYLHKDAFEQGFLKRADAYKEAGFGDFLKAISGKPHVPEVDWVSKIKAGPTPSNPVPNWGKLKTRGATQLPPATPISDEAARWHSDKFIP